MIPATTVAPAYGITTLGEVSKKMQILIVILLLFLTSRLVDQKTLHWEMRMRVGENREG